jgi:hypothetical protein
MRIRIGFCRAEEEEVMPAAEKRVGAGCQPSTALLRQRVTYTRIILLVDNVGMVFPLHRLSIVAGSFGHGRISDKPNLWL